VEAASMKKYYWLAGVSAFLWVVVFGQPVAGVRYCLLTNSILTESGRAELVRQEVMPRLSNDQVNKEKYYPEIRDDLEQMFSMQKKCASDKGDENCRGAKIDEARSYRWQYDDNYLGTLGLVFIRQNRGQVMINISKPTCEFNGDMEGGIGYERWFK
jgi:hypothetical protein